MSNASGCLGNRRARRRDLCGSVSNERGPFEQRAGRRKGWSWGEAGIAQTLGRQVVFITQNGDDIPFDLRHLRYIHYLNNAEGRAALTAMLTDGLQTLIGH